MFFKCLSLQDNCQIINYDPGVIDTGMQKYIRSSTFKNVDAFQLLQKQNLLKKTEDVANDLFNKHIKGFLNG